MNPLIPITTPNYNRENLIGETLDNVFASIQPINSIPSLK